MIVIVDKVVAIEIGRRDDIHRYYYVVDALPSLLLVAQGQPLAALQGRRAALLINVATIDSTIVCDIFPAAPQRWRDERIIQVSLAVKPVMRGPARALSAALREINKEKL